MAQRDSQCWGSSLDEAICDESCQSRITQHLALLYLWPDLPRDAPPAAPCAGL